jgi:hypothetical protein
MTDLSGSSGLSGLGRALTGIPIQKEDDPYFAALGRFIVGYASAEHQVHALAIRLTQVTDKKGRIIFSGMRLGDLADRVRGLLRVMKASTKIFNEADACITQLDLVGKRRNNLVHRFVMYHQQAIWVTNLPIAKSDAAIENERLTLTDLENMHMDCVCIMLRLTYVWGRKPATKRDRDTLQWSRRPWRYKPPQPAPKRK